MSEFRQTKRLTPERLSRMQVIAALQRDSPTKGLTVKFTNETRSPFVSRDKVQSRIEASPTEVKGCGVVPNPRKRRTVNQLRYQQDR
jgi:hypothetical protein